MSVKRINTHDHMTALEAEFWRYCSKFPTVQPCEFGELLRGLDAVVARIAKARVTSSYRAAIKMRVALARACWIP